MTYLKDPEAIYALSFETIRRECDLSSIPAEARNTVIRMVHACGMPEIVPDIVVTPDFASLASQALCNGAPVLTDAEMVRHGIINKAQDVICTLNDPRARQIGVASKTTRSAASVDLWRDKLAGSVVAIGNAPTALFRLLEIIDETSIKPAAIVGMPVGFVGAAESKQALIDNPRGVPFITLRGRKGGSAMAAAVVNALHKGLA